MLTKSPISKQLSELNEETKKAVELARAEIKAGKFYTHNQVKKKLDI